jgi:stage II sporulation protein GA (sporulation sigma-E factor processing peptidase)
MRTVIYLDEVLVKLCGDLLVNLLLFWATAQITKLRRPFWRLLSAAVLGTLYEFGYLGASWGLWRGFAFFASPIVMLSVFVLMLLLAFFPLPGRRFLAVGGYFILIGLVSSGAGIMAGYMFAENSVVKYVTAIAAILALAELGWGVVHKVVWQELLHVPITVRLGAAQVEIEALLDTANNLRDPLTGDNVIIVEAQALGSLLPKELLAAVSAREFDFSELTAAVADTPWAQRFRLLPYSSIGMEHGMLIGLRPDEVTFSQGKSKHRLEDVVIGIYQRSFQPEGEYSALMHPEILQLATLRN